MKYFVVSSAFVCFSTRSTQVSFTGLLIGIQFHILFHFLCGYNIYNIQLLTRIIRSTPHTAHGQYGVDHGRIPCLTLVSTPARGWRLISVVCFVRCVAVCVCRTRQQQHVRLVCRRIVNVLCIVWAYLNVAIVYKYMIRGPLAWCTWPLFYASCSNLLFNRIPLQLFHPTRYCSVFHKTKTHFVVLQERRQGEGRGGGTVRFSCRWMQTRN